MTARGTSDTARQDWVPNLTWITDHLAVGGRFPIARAEDLARSHGIRAVLDLRSEDRDDEAVLHHHGIALLHLPTRGIAFEDLGIRAGVK